MQFDGFLEMVNAMLVEKKVIDYVNEVDSISPAPGGGSVASLIGALGVSLAKMLAHFSVEKKKFKEADIRKKNKFILAFKELDHYKDILLKGIDDDAISYECVVEAFKSKEEERIQKALMTSALVAYDMQEAAKDALKNVRMLIELGNKNLYSDLISSAILLASCCEMASLNVIANAKMLKDEKIKEHYLTSSALLVKQSKSLKNQIVRSINKI